MTCVASEEWYWLGEDDGDDEDDDDEDIDDFYC